MSVAEVMLWGTRIGIVSYEDGDAAARFEYDRAFLGSGIEPAPLMMPLSSRVYSFPEIPAVSFHGLPGMLADSLPDRYGNAVIDEWLAAQGRVAGSLNPVERLCYTGNRGMGALEYIPALGPDKTDEARLEVDRLVELANAVLAKRLHMSVQMDDPAMSQLISVGTSAGGARAKAIVAFNEQTGELRSGQVDQPQEFGQWIIKFDGVSGNRDKEAEDEPSYTRIEYAYHLMALDAGIEMSECRLLEEGGRAHFMTRRFDRPQDGPGKLHMQTLAGMAHFDFNSAGANSYEQAANVMRRLGMGQNEIEQLCLRMCFNIMTRNHDDHVKNISFLMDKQGKWSLAPAYDVTYAFNPRGAWTSRHQMSANGKLEGFTPDDLLAVADHMSISARRARRLAEGLSASVRKWRVF